MKLADLLLPLLLFSARIAQATSRPTARELPPLSSSESIPAIGSVVEGPSARENSAPIDFYSASHYHVDAEGNLKTLTLTEILWISFRQEASQENWDKALPLLKRLFEPPIIQELAGKELIKLAGWVLHLCQKRLPDYEGILLDAIHKLTPRVKGVDLGPDYGPLWILVPFYQHSDQRNAVRDILKNFKQRNIPALPSGNWELIIAILQESIHVDKRHSYLNILVRNYPLVPSEMNKVLDAVKIRIDHLEEVTQGFLAKGATSIFNGLYLEIKNTYQKIVWDRLAEQSIARTLTAEEISLLRILIKDKVHTQNTEPAALQHILYAFILQLKDKPRITSEEINDLSELMRQFNLNHDGDAVATLLTPASFEMLEFIQKINSAVQNSYLQEQVKIFLQHVTNLKEKEAEKQLPINLPPWLAVFIGLLTIIILNFVRARLGATNVLETQTLSDTRSQDTPQHLPPEENVSSVTTLVSTSVETIEDKINELLGQVENTIEIWENNLQYLDKLEQELSPLQTAMLQESTAVQPLTLNFEISAEALEADKHLKRCLTEKIDEVNILKKQNAARMAEMREHLNNFLAAQKQMANAFDQLEEIKPNIYLTLLKQRADLLKQSVTKFENTLKEIETSSSKLLTLLKKTTDELKRNIQHKEHALVNKNKQEYLSKEALDRKNEICVQALDAFMKKRKVGTLRTFCDKNREIILEHMRKSNDAVNFKNLPQFEKWLKVLCVKLLNHNTISVSTKPVVTKGVMPPSEVSNPGAVTPPESAKIAPLAEMVAGASIPNDSGVNSVINHSERDMAAPSSGHTTPLWYGEHEVLLKKQFAEILIISELLEKYAQQLRDDGGINSAEGTNVKKQALRRVVAYTIIQIFEKCKVIAESLGDDRAFIKRLFHFVNFSILRNGLAHYVYDKQEHKLDVALCELAQKFSCLRKIDLNFLSQADHFIRTITKAPIDVSVGSFAVTELFAQFAQRFNSEIGRIVEDLPILQQQLIMAADLLEEFWKKTQDQSLSVDENTLFMWAVKVQIATVAEIFTGLLMLNPTFAVHNSFSHQINSFRNATHHDDSLTMPQVIAAKQAVKELRDQLQAYLGLDTAIPHNATAAQADRPAVPSERVAAAVLPA